MDNIWNYIKNGKGVGAIVILFISVIFSSISAISIRNISHMSIPYIQMIADDVLPLKIENGVITTPANTKKVFPVFIDDKEIQYSFVIDTTVDTLDPEKAENGIYLTRTHMYAVDNIQGQVKSRKLRGNITLERKDYTDTLKSCIKWVVIAFAVIETVFLFITFFILNIFYAYCAQIAEKFNNITLNFDAKMRLSAICLSFMLLVSFALEFLRINISWIIFIILVCCLQTILIKKIAKQ